MYCIARANQGNDSWALQMLGSLRKLAFTSTYFTCFIWLQHESCDLRKSANAWHVHTLYTYCAQLWVILSGHCLGAKLLWTFLARGRRGHILLESSNTRLVCAWHLTWSHMAERWRRDLSDKATGCHWLSASSIDCLPLDWIWDKLSTKIKLFPQLQRIPRIDPFLVSPQNNSVSPMIRAPREFCYRI